MTAHSTDALVRPHIDHQPVGFFLCQEGAGRVGAVAAEPTAMEEFDNGVIADLEGDEGAEAQAEAQDLQGEEERGDAEEQQPDELVCEPCGPEESQEAKTGPFHVKPSAKEVELHRLHHHPYRSWCPWCVRAKLKASIIIVWPSTRLCRLLA